MDRLEALHEVSHFEAGFADEVEFGETFSRILKKFDRTFDNQISPKRANRRSSIERINKEFNHLARKSVVQLSNVMEGYDRSFTLYRPRVAVSKFFTHNLYLTTNREKRKSRPKRLQIKSQHPWCKASVQEAPSYNNHNSQ